VSAGQGSGRPQGLVQSNGGFKVPGVQASTNPPSKAEQSTLSGTPVGHDSAAPFMQVTLSVGLQVVDASAAGCGTQAVQLASDGGKPPQ